MPTSLVSLDTSVGLSLWADYVLTAHKHCASLPLNRYIEIRYENLLRDPEAELLGIARFASVDAGANQVDKAASRVKRLQRSIEPSPPVCRKAQRALEMYNYL